MRYLLQGVALGAVIGLLFAPKSGSQTREELGEWLKRKRRQARELASETGERAREYAGAPEYDEEVQDKDLAGI